MAEKEPDTAELPEEAGAEPEAAAAEDETPDPEGPRRWNLGKQRSGKVKVAAPTGGAPQNRPAPGAKPLPKPPVRPDGAKLALPKSKAPSDSHSSIIIPGRPVDKPQNFRDYLNHPFTVIICGLIISLTLLWIVVLRPGGGRSRQAVEDTVTLGDRTVAGSGAGAMFSANQDGEAQVVGDIGTQVEKDGRMLLQTGEMLLRVAEHLSSDPQGRQPVDNLSFYPVAIMTRPLPPEDSIEYVLADSQMRSAADDLVGLARQAVQQARARQVSAEEIRRAGTRLVAEGLALLDVHVSNPRARQALAMELRTQGLPALDGSMGALPRRMPDISSAQLGGVVTELTTPEYALLVREAHGRNFNGW